MKTTVTAHLVARCEVQIEVEHEEGEDPTHLTEEEGSKAASHGESWPEWDVERVTT